MSIFANKRTFVLVTRGPFVFIITFVLFWLRPIVYSYPNRYLRAALLPNSQLSLRTSLVSGALLKPVFGNSFAVPIPLNKLYTKTLQVNVLSVVGQREEIVVSCLLYLQRIIALIAIVSMVYLTKRTLFLYL